MEGMTNGYSEPLIVASLAMSTVASYAAFCFTERITQSEGARKNWWLVGGSVVMGLGIWSMHYLGMLAVHMRVEVFYSLPIVLLSLALAVFASLAALHFVSKADMRGRDLLLGSILLGSGIGAMHYTGMAAMRSCASQTYSVGGVLASVAIALGFSWLSLLITFRLRNRKANEEWLRMGGAVVMGGGIAAMHYTAMAAVTFTPEAGPMAMSAGALDIRALSGFGVTMTTSTVLIGALLTAFLDRVTYRSLNKAHQQLVDAHRQLAEAQSALLESEQALREANEQLRELSVRDGLTRLYNRRHLDQSLETEWRQASRTRSQISMLMIDVDHFKALNDEYGHPTGDLVLQRIAMTLIETMQGTGSLVARYGGEEFAIILPGGRASDALAAAERVRRAVFAMEIENKRSAAHAYLSVSVGVCSIMPSHGDSLTAFVEMADQALYQAKALGRNRTHSLEWRSSSRADHEREERRQQLSVVQMLDAQPVTKLSAMD